MSARIESREADEGRVTGLGCCYITRGSSSITQSARRISEHQHVLYDQETIHIQPFTFFKSRMHPSSAMTLRITTGSDGQRTTLRLSGRIRSTDIENIRESMKGKAETIVLDLEGVTLVDLDVVRFLGVGEAEGVELVNCSPYIRDWIFRERNTEEGD